MATGAIQVRGLRDLTRDFQKMSKDIGQDVSWELEEVADVVAQESERLVLGEMSGMPSTSYYATTKVGVAKGKGVVYVVPAWRGHSKRSEKQRAQVQAAQQKRYEAALAANETEVVQKLEQLIDRLGGEYDFY